MKSTKIAVPTNDGKTIFPKMLGMAKVMYIYNVTNNSDLELIEKRTNPFENTMQHLKTLDVYDLISDCSVIISAHIGKKGITRLEKKGMKLFIRRGKIEEAIIDIIKERDLNDNNNL